MEFGPTADLAEGEPAAVGGPGEDHASFAEVAPVSDHCQRWDQRRHSWVHRRDGGFDANRYEVREIAGDAIARSYVTQHHYLATYPAAVARYGLYVDASLRHGDDDDGLVGVAVFSVPTSLGVITKPFPGLDYTTACELGRLVLEGPRACEGGLQRAPANAESFFVARCLSDLAARGYRGVVSFADPVPRQGVAAGRRMQVSPGHTGIVYQSLGMRYTGRGTARTIVVLPDGRSISQRALQKVRAQERGHDYVERRLCALGASVPHAGADMAAWLSDALEAVGARRIRHRGNHRFVAVLGNRAERRKVTVALDALAYPKRSDAR